MEAARLADVFDTSLAAKALESFTGGLSVRAAMESVKSPWLDAANPSVSASAFAVIQQMGSAIGNTWRTSWARCRPTRIPAFIIFMATARSTKLPAE
jgi:hypothetical protein